MVQICILKDCIYSKAINVKKKTNNVKFFRVSKSWTPAWNPAINRSEGESFTRLQLEERNVASNSVFNYEKLNLKALILGEQE